MNSKDTNDRTPFHKGKKMYPIDFPLQELQNIVNIVRNNEVATKKEDFAHDIWWVQGYAQRVLIGAPPEIIALKVQNEIDPITVLEKIIDTNKPTTKAQGVIDNIPWKEFLKWALQQLIEQYLV